MERDRSSVHKKSGRAGHTQGINDPVLHPPCMLPHLPVYRRDLHQITLRSYHEEHQQNEVDYETPLDEMYCRVFSHACRIIRDLPLPTNVKRLRICHNPLVFDYTRVTPIANEVGRLFKSLGPLEELTLDNCDMRPYFDPSTTLPPIKEFTILNSLCPPHEGFEAAIVGLAELQHTVRVPFGRVNVQIDNPPVEMAERLRPWVGVGNC